jgi:hypothetical protein
MKRVIDIAELALLSADDERALCGGSRRQATPSMRCVLPSAWMTGNRTQRAVSVVVCHNDAMLLRASPPRESASPELLTDKGEAE